jgi:hypothetical protein
VKASAVSCSAASIMGRHEDRTTLARELGATDVVAERGEDAVERIRELTGRVGVHGVLECVGTEQSMQTSVEIARPEGAVGRVFDRTVSIDDVPDGYRAMADRESIKVLVRP